MKKKSGIKIDTEKLKTSIESGIEAVYQGWESETTCIGNSGGGYQIHLTITKDESYFIDPVKDHICVSGI